MAIKRKDSNGNWVLDQQAIETSIIDLEGNFESTNVEGALRELAEQQKSGANLTELEDKIETNRLGIISNANKIANLQKQIENGGSVPRDLVDRVATLENEMITAKEDIEYLMANGGGGGSSAVPTIKSDFEDCAIDKGSDVVIPIFFTSPNMGDGTAYILVNNIQVDTAGVKQGNNNVRVKAQYLVNTDNKVAIYVKDRAGIVTNQLSWTIIAGGIDLTSTFDYEVDYGITDTIRIPYTIETGIEGTITTYLTIDGNTTEYTSVNGYNFIDLLGGDLGLGTHSVQMYSTVGKYTSKTLSFNVVIISTTELYLSSTFVSGGEYTYGQLISVNYRLSKQSTEEFNVFLKIDDRTVKTVTTTVGNYFWTIQSLAVGEHTLTIQVVSLDYSEVKELNLQVTVIKGEYVAVEPYTLGLLCDLNAVGKSNTDIDVTTWRDASGNGHDGKLVNFNFGTNGFVNDELVCDNDAYVVIEWSPWKQNAITGSTIDIIYTPINSGIEDCRIIDYTTITDDTSTAEVKPFKGVFADVLQAIGSSASSGASASKVNLDDQSGEIHLTWVLDRDKKFLKTYIDGILCRIMYLTDSGSGTNKFYEDFSHDGYIYLNSTKGKNCGTNNIKRFRVYDHALTSEQVLQNHMANITDLDAQEQYYNFNYNNTTLPKMYLNGDITNMTAYQTVPMTIEYISPDEEKYGQSFNTGIQNNQVKIQGTSSLQYVRHNYTIYLKDEYGADMYYNPYGEGSVADYVFCLKADYVESSHANNTGCAKFVNDCLYDTKTPMQLDNENCRTAINGFPIEVYINGEYLGVYNFNHDRYSYMSYGYDYIKYPNMLVYEINSNSNTSAGAFYRYGDNPESSANVTELEYYKRDFNLIYGSRTTESDTYSEIKTLVEWVSVAEQDLFRETISEHFNTEYLFRYFLMVLLIGAVDSLGKNMKIMTVDGKVWYPTFYDMDTVLGIDNTGYLTILPDVEIESGSYNTSNSNLWTKVWNFFRTELQAEWSAMRQGKFTLDNLMEYIYGQQIEVIPAKYYNDDAEVKYLQFGSLYTYCCHGDKRHQIKRWLRERIAYVDSMMGYFTSQEDQVTIRMNKTGYVSFDITTYIPLYFSVKWSNATGGTQTFKMARGETRTFYYTSTTSTDQEVIVYHAQYIKNLDNLSNLNPSSCILANAKKLTNVEIHSTELYNINVTNNTFLRTINLEGCTTLGTVTATGSSLDLSNCKYLRYCNVYNTALTEVQLNTSGGSLTEIYYPSTLQSMTLIKQTLLERIGLPYGTNGREVPTALYTVNIQECPNIKYLNTSDDPSINTTFASMYYCNNLTLRNSLDLEGLNFDGFHRLRNVTIENMYKLQSVGFNNLLPVGNTSTLKYVGFSNCPLLEEIELNCTSNDYEIAFDTNSILNFGGLSALKSISSNCVIKGLDTIVLPLKLESMYFTTEYGEGFSEIKNLWSSAVCNVNIAGSTVECIHVIEGYEGIDFAGMNLKNIDLGGLVNIKDAINFSLSPTTVNPNFNKNRDGVTYPYLQPSGTLDLSNYTESLAKFFDGVDLRKLQLICNNPLPQKDLSYCFYNSTFDKDSQISAVLNNIDTVNNMAYCFYKTSVKDVSILNSVNFLAGTSLAHCFAECKNISKLQNITLSGNIGNASYMFSGSGLTTIDNVSTSCNNIVGMFSYCDNLVTVNNFDANGTTSYESLFEGCGGMSVAPVTTIPATITNIKYMYKDCDGLISIDGFVLHGNITEATGFIEGCNNLINANNVTISGSFYNDIFRGLTSLRYVNNLLINYVGRSMTFAHMFDGCTNLLEMSFHDDSYVKDVISMDYMFRGTSMTGVDFSNVNFEKITSIKYMFADCFMEEFSYTIPKTITNLQGFLSGCSNLKTLRNFHIESNVVVTDWLLNSPIENLIDCTFYNQNSTFVGVTTLKRIENVKYLTANFSNYFEGCTSLQTALITIPNTVTKTNSLFKNCPELTRVEFTSDSDLSNLLTINDMFNGDTKLSTIVNMKITNPNTSANTTTLTGCPINNTDGLYLNSNSVMTMFRMGAESRITKFTDFELGENANNLYDLFMDYPNLIEDIELPLHVVNVSNMFKNCLRMENIHSNWSKPYTRNQDDDLSNDVITSGCYEGCDNIKYIDGDLYMNEYGELTAMSVIPPDWGGKMTFEDDQTAFDIKIEADTDMTYTMLGEVGEYKTDWGDGTVDMNVTHTYERPGVYTVVTYNVDTFGIGSVLDSSISLPIVRFRFLNKSQTNGSHLFDGFENMLQLDKLEGNTFNSYECMFNNCSKLKDVDLGGCTFSQSVKDMSYMFNNCRRFTINPINIIPDSVTNITNLYYNTEIKDLSGMTFGSKVSSCTNWYPPKLENIRDCIIKTNINLFQGNTTLKYISGITRPNSDSWTNYFNGCTSLLEDIIFPSSTTNVVNCFHGCSKLTHAHSNWNNTYTKGITATDCYAGCTSITHFDGEDILRYEGDLGIDYIPTDWGGNGFTDELTGIYVFNIPSDNYALKFNGYTVDDGTIRVNWGDGSMSVELTHTYATAGTYTVKGKVWCSTHIPNGNGQGPDSSICNSLIKVLKVPQVTSPTSKQSLAAMFAGCKLLEWADISDAPMKDVLFARSVFLGCQKLKYANVSCGAVGKSDNYNGCAMNSYFSSCGELTEIVGLDTWDFTGLIRLDITRMFEGCLSLTSIDTTGWNLSGITNMNNVFNRCTSLKTIIGHENWDLSSTSEMGLTFYQCTSLETLDVTNWNCGNGVNGVFQGSGLKKVIGIENLVNSRWTNMGSLFRGCPLEELNISNWDTSNVIDFQYAFNGNKFTEVVGLENLNMDSCKYADFMFANCTNLTDLSKGVFKSSFETSLDTGQGFMNTFSGCTSLKKIGRVINKGSWKACFQGCTSLESIAEINTSTTYATTYLIFQGCNSLTSVNFTGTGYRQLTGANNNSTWHYPDFDHDSMLSLFNWLNPNGATNYGTPSSPLKLKASALARMTDEEISIATNKGWYLTGV